MSGQGRELGEYGLEAYTEVKSVSEDLLIIKFVSQDFRTSLNREKEFWRRAFLQLRIQLNLIIPWIECTVPGTYKPFDQNEVPVLVPDMKAFVQLFFFR